MITTTIIIIIIIIIIIKSKSTSFGLALVRRQAFLEGRQDYKPAPK